MDNQKLDLKQFEGHTQGPWEIVDWTPDGEDAWSGHCEIYGGQVGEDEVLDFGDELNSTDVINLKLMAAAPQLLELAQKQAEQLAKLEAASKQLWATSQGLLDDHYKFYHHAWQSDWKRDVEKPTEQTSGEVRGAYAEAAHQMTKLISVWK